MFILGFLVFGITMSILFRIAKIIDKYTQE